MAFIEPPRGDGGQVWSERQVRRRGSADCRQSDLGGIHVTGKQEAISAAFLKWVTIG